MSEAFEIRLQRFTDWKITVCGELSELETHVFDTLILIIIIILDIHCGQFISA